MRRTTNSTTKLAFVLLVAIIVLPMGQAWAIILKGYSADGKDAWLEYSDKIVTVKFKKGTCIRQMQNIALKYSTVLISDSLFDRLFSGFKKMRIPAGLSRDNFIKELLQEDSVEYVTPLCFMEGREYILANEFVVGFKPGVTREEVIASNNAFINQHPYVTVISRYQRFNGGWRCEFRVAPDAPLNAVDLSNLYYDAPIVEYANPDLGLVEDPLCGTTAVKPTSRHLAITWVAIKRSAQ